jgi:hypothetical protein
MEEHEYPFYQVLGYKHIVVTKWVNLECNVEKGEEDMQNIQMIDLTISQVLSLK